MNQPMSMYNPPIAQRGSDACYGSADPIKDFGDTPETEHLIEQPKVQRSLLRGETPYQCHVCKTIFFVERWIIDMYISSYRRAGFPTGQPPGGFLCVKSRYVVNRKVSPPKMQPVPSIFTVGTAVIEPNETDTNGPGPTPKE